MYSKLKIKLQFFFFFLVTYNSTLPTFYLFIKITTMILVKYGGQLVEQK